MIYGALAAQTQQQPAARRGIDFYERVTNTLAPTKVFDREGGMVNGVRPQKFHLFDNGREQKLRVDESLIPISVEVSDDGDARMRTRPGYWMPSEAQ